MKCRWCLHEFAAQRSTKKFCSAKCRVYHHRWQDAERNERRALRAIRKEAREHAKQNYLAACRVPFIPPETALKPTRGTRVTWAANPNAMGVGQDDSRRYGRATRPGGFSIAQEERKRAKQLARLASLDARVRNAVGRSLRIILPKE